MGAGRVGTVLYKELRKSGRQQKEVAARLGMSPQALNRILRGRVGDPGFGVIYAIGEELKVDWGKLLSEHRDELLDALGEVTVSQIDPGAAEAQPQPDADGKLLLFEVPPEEFIEGDWDYPQTWRRGEAGVNGSIAAGPLDDSDDAEYETAEVLNPTLRDVQSGRYGVTRVKGRSMEPRLHHGDLVLIDTFEKEPKPHRIMAVYRRGVGSAFGYLHKVGGVWILAKANAAEFPPVPLDGEFVIRGVVKKRLEETLD